jgi:hypothetical protein
MASGRNRRVIFWVLAAFCTGALVSSSTRPPYPIVERAGVIVLRNDPGGDVNAHLKWLDRIGAAHMPVRIEGYCNSACTFVLKLPARQVCVTPDVTLGFHQVFDPATGKNLPRVTKRIVRDVYPKPVRDWIRVHGPLRSDVIEMTAKTAIALGVVRACA